MTKTWRQIYRNLPKKSFKFPGIPLVENNFRGPFLWGPFFRGSLCCGPFFREIFFVRMFYPGTFFPGSIFSGDYFCQGTIFTGTFFPPTGFNSLHFKKAVFSYKGTGKRKTQNEISACKLYRWKVVLQVGDMHELLIEVLSSFFPSLFQWSIYIFTLLSVGTHRPERIKDARDIKKDKREKETEEYIYPRCPSLCGWNFE